MRNPTSARIAFLVLLAGLAFAPASRMQAQGTDLATIRGNVVDASGGAIPGASVTITDTETGIKRVVKTNAIGEFEANGLKTGTYKVLIEASGFNGLELSGLPLRMGEVARADGRLEIEKGAQSVVVHEQASLIQKVSTQFELSKPAPRTVANNR